METLIPAPLAEKSVLSSLNDAAVLVEDQLPMNVGGLSLGAYICPRASTMLTAVCLESASPSCLFFSKLVLAVLGPLNLHMNFRIH